MSPFKVRLDDHVKRFRHVPSSLVLWGDNGAGICPGTAHGRLLTSKGTRWRELCERQVATSWTVAAGCVDQVEPVATKLKPTTVSTISLGFRISIIMQKV
jgi:hypothetical protein